MSAEQYQSGERRPIASRERKSSQAVAHWLSKKGVAPNSISVAGMICAVAGGAAFAATRFEPEWQRYFWLAGAACTQLRLLANMFDGMVAIETRRASAVGELYNEVPDRMSDAAMFIGVGYSLGGNPLLGLGATCVAFFTAYIRAMGKVAGTKQEFCGPMAKQHRMFVVTVMGVFLGFSPASWQIVPSGAWGNFGIPSVALALIIAGGLLTAWRRLSRIAATLRQTQS
jgi:phosphatidylglycerophosphate synthase